MSQHGRRPTISEEPVNRRAKMGEMPTGTIFVGEGLAQYRQKAIVAMVKPLATVTTATTTLFDADWPQAKPIVKTAIRNRVVSNASLGRSNRTRGSEELTDEGIILVPAVFNQREEE